MTNPNNKDIRDDEIRFVIRKRQTRDVRYSIASDEKAQKPCCLDDNKPSGCRWKFLLIVVAAVAAVVLAAVLLWPSSDPPQDQNKTVAVVELADSPEAVPAAGSDQQPTKRGKAYTELTDTAVGGRQLTILKPIPSFTLKKIFA